jgi:hypothetical protein
MKYLAVVVIGMMASAIGYWIVSSDARKLERIKACVLDEVEFELGAIDGPTMRRRVEIGTKSVFVSMEAVDEYIATTGSSGADDVLSSAIIICRAKEG